MLHPILKDKKACLFDMDGTLLDSMYVWETVDEHFFGFFGREVPPNLQQEIGGMSFTETADYIRNQYQISMTGEEIRDVWNRLASEEYAQHVCFKPGALAFLQYIKELGLKTAICTSNSRELLKAADSHLNLSRYIDVFVTACEVKRGKPFPDVYLAAAQKLKVLPEECLCFEDILPGVQAGLNAGMQVCAVEDQHAALDRSLIKEAAQLYISDYHTLLYA
ncbi:MAG: HAD family phosphatase [Lachnospiraceae bacterium]|nr:HAD family phosphatase [Lachnospiraceae bacterium]